MTANFIINTLLFLQRGERKRNLFSPKKSKNTCKDIVQMMSFRGCHFKKGWFVAFISVTLLARLLWFWQYLNWARGKGFAKCHLKDCSVCWFSVVWKRFWRQLTSRQMKPSFARDAEQSQQSWAVCSGGACTQDTGADQVTVGSVDGLWGLQILSSVWTKYTLIPSSKSKKSCFSSE